MSPPIESLPVLVLIVAASFHDFGQCLNLCAFMRMTRLLFTWPISIHTIDATTIIAFRFRLFV